MSDTLAQRPGFLVRRLHQIHVALFAEECAEFDVTPVQYSILTVAGARPDLDQASLAAEVGVDRATMANVVARLEAKGLVRRRHAPADKRVKLVALSARGAALLRAMAGPVQRAHDRTVAALPAAERAAFLALLRRLVAAQNETGRAPLRLGDGERDF
jgi:DNA-binding MarR family transcriptional regulator